MFDYIMSREAIPELQSDLERIAKEIKTLRRKKGRVMKKYIVKAKNPLMGFKQLFGDPRRRLSPPEAKNDLLIGSSRHYYFADIKYRSKLKRIDTRISSLEGRYDQKLSELRMLVSSPVY